MGIGEIEAGPHLVRVKKKGGSRQVLLDVDPEDLPPKYQKIQFTAKYCMEDVVTGQIPNPASMVIEYCSKCQTKTVFNPDIILLGKHLKSDPETLESIAHLGEVKTELVIE